MTIRTASEAQATVQPRGLRVGLVTVTSTFSPGTEQSIAAGDIIQMVKFPANAVPVYVAVSSDYFQASITVGDGLDDDRYVTIRSTSAAMLLTTINTVYTPYKYSTDDTIDIFVSLVSVTSILGSFTLFAIYSMDADR